MSHKPDVEAVEVQPQDRPSAEGACAGSAFLLADYAASGPVPVELVDHPVDVERPPVEALVADSQCEV